MEPAQPEKPICHSCAMPMQNPDDFGTNGNGSLSNEYCYFCYQKGKFAEPDITMSAMIENVVIIMSIKMGISEADAKKIAETSIPGLKRWQK